MRAIADLFPAFGKRGIICLLSFTYNYVVCLARFPLPLGVVDGLHYFIVALTEPFI